MRAGLCLLLAALGWPAAAPGGERLSGEPLPRYAAIRASEANLRVGPSKAHGVVWRYLRRGLPVRIVAEHFQWRRIVDPDGETGWMSAHLLADWPRAIVKDAVRELHRRPEAGAGIAALLEPGVLLAVRERRAGWCEVAAGGHVGWVRTAEVWGACAPPGAEGDAMQAKEQ